MLRPEGYVEIQVLRHQGESIRAISAVLVISRNTVRKYLRSERLPQPRQAPPAHTVPRRPRRPTTSASRTPPTIVRRRNRHSEPFHRDGSGARPRLNTTPNGSRR